MDIRILRYFLAVAREENITKAAQSLHIAQPSLSRQMAELEREVGTPLFLREKRKITLTEDGLLLRRRAEELTALLDKTEQELRADAGSVTGQVSIGGGPARSVTAAAAAARAREPGLCFHFYSGAAAEVTALLDRGSLDFAALLEPVDTLRYERLVLPDAARWGVLLRRDDPLAARSAITRRELLGLPLVLHQREGLRRELELWAGAEPGSLNVAATFNIIHGHPADFVACGLGNVVLFRSMVEQEESDAVCFRPLDPPLEIPYALVWKRYAVLSRPSAVFLDEVRRQLKA